MRGQPLVIVILIVIACAVRFGLAVLGYAVPEVTLEALGAPVADNPQAPYVVRVWAVRDMVLAVLLLAARPAMLVPLLIGCIVIDATDIVSALLSGRAGQFSHDQTLGLVMTAVAALLPESIALALIRSRI